MNVWTNPVNVLNIFFKMSMLKKKSSFCPMLLKQIISSIIPKSSKKKGKRNSARFRNWPGQTSLWQDRFCAGQKVSEEWKTTFAWPKKVLRNIPYIPKNKGFRDLISVKSKWPQHYITLQMKLLRKKWQILWVSKNQQFRKLSGVFVFTLENFSPVSV